MNLIVNRAGEHAASITGHGDAYVIGERIGGGRYLVTPDTGHVWYDAGGDRCSDLGSAERLPSLPPDEANEAAWERWAAETIVAAHAAGVRIEE